MHFTDRYDTLLHNYPTHFCLHWLQHLSHCQSISQRLLILLFTLHLGVAVLLVQYYGLTVIRCFDKELLVRVSANFGHNTCRGGGVDVPFGRGGVL